MNHPMKKSFVVFSACLLCLLAIGCNKKGPDAPPTLPLATLSPLPTLAPTPLPTVAPTPSPTQTPVPTPTPSPTPKTVSLLAVGDDLVHGSTLTGGLQKDGSYDFNGFYTHLKDEISAADIAIINQETILGGSDIPYSGYPRFNTPDSMGDAIVNAGFDVVLHATNHTMDCGAKAIEHCMEYWETNHPEITVLGIHDSAEAENTITVVEKNGMRLAMLNFTYSLNGIKLPSDKMYLVTMLTWENREFIRNQIRAAKEVADFVIVFPHWGTEYVYQPDKDQKFWTNLFAEEGVDLVIGAHPHVLEPVEWITRPDGEKMLVFYSLGNFISGQIEAPRILGGMAEITLTEDENGKISVTDCCVVPVITHYSETVGDGTYSIYRLSEYTEELAKIHGIHKRAEESVFTLDGTWELAREILGEYLKE